MSNNARTKNKTNLHRLTMLAIFTAIILMLTFTPLGYLPGPGIQITIIMIPVAIGAIMTDAKGGLFLGFIFGISSLAVGFLGGGVQLIINLGTGILGKIVNTLLVIIWLVVPRTLMGFLVAVIFKLISKIDKTNTISFLVASLSGAVLNTVLYSLFLLITFGANDAALQTIGVGNAWAIILGVISTNALIEALVSLLVGGAISKALSLYLPGGKKHKNITDKNRINSETTDTAVDQGENK